MRNFGIIKDHQLYMEAYAGNAKTYSDIHTFVSTPNPENCIWNFLKTFLLFLLSQIKSRYKGTLNTDQLHVYINVDL